MSQTDSNLLDRPLVSILTPSFNQSQWLEDNLRSVSCQTYRNIEHIVMDGGSTDDSRHVLERASDHVLWQSEPDNGQSHAINKALARSRGEVIGWLNSDDAYFDRGTIQHVVDYFARHPNVEVAYGHGVRTDANGRVIWVMWVPRFSYVRLRWFCYLVQPAVFFRRSVLSTPMLDESYHFAMDWELWLRLAARYRFGRIDRILAVDRYQPARKSKVATDVHRQDEDRLRMTYGAGTTALRQLLHRVHGVRQRLMGGLKLGDLYRAELAFAGHVEPLGAQLMRQVFIPQSRWPERDRVTGR